MKGTLIKRLFRAIFSENNRDLKKLALTIIEDEKNKGHNNLAEELEKIFEKYSKNHFSDSTKAYQENSLSKLPISKRNNKSLTTFLPPEKLEHHMILPENIEKRFKRIEQEYVAKSRLAKFNLSYKKKILLYGPPGCGKTLGAQRLAWNIGLPLIKVRFDSLVSSYLGESASNLREVFDYVEDVPSVLLLDECDFIAKSRNYNQDVGEISRIVNMLLLLLDEYSGDGLVVATTNIKFSLDKALFRRFDDVLELPLPGEKEKVELLKMTLSAIKVEKNIDWISLADMMNNFSAANVVAVAKNAAKYSVLKGSDIIRENDLVKAVDEMRIANE